MKNRDHHFLSSLKHALQTLITIAPMLLAVIGLVGLFKTYVTPEMIHSFFTGEPITDTFIGTLAGAISVGQVFISYMIGSELSSQGVTLYAITAFILSFVTLGIIQLPLEYTLFGMRFTLVRNLLALVFAIVISLAVVVTLQWIG